MLLLDQSTLTFTKAETASLFGLRRYIGGSASFINSAINTAFVLFIPFGIVGTWRMKSFQVKQGWERLRQTLNN